MTRPAPTLLPYRFDRAGRHLLVQLVDPARLDWRAGFFLMGLPQRSSDAIVPLDRFLADGTTELPPALSDTGCIFHVSRCGSTLLAQNIKATGRAVVLSEPPLFRILRPPIVDLVGATEAVRALSHALAQWQAWARAQDRSLVVKFNSQLHQHRAKLMAAMPGARFLFLHREPLPVFESLLRKTPQFLRPEALRSGASPPPAVADATSDPVLRAAAGHYLSALDAFAGIEDERLRIVGYPALAARFREIAEHLLGAPAADAVLDARTNAKAHLAGATARYRPVPAEYLARFAEEHARLLSLTEASYRRFLSQPSVATARMTHA